MLNRPITPEKVYGIEIITNKMACSVVKLQLILKTERDPVKESTDEKSHHRWGIEEENKLLKDVQCTLTYR